MHSERRGVRFRRACRSAIAEVCVRHAYPAAASIPHHLLPETSVRNGTYNSIVSSAGNRAHVVQSYGPGLHVATRRDTTPTRGHVADTRFMHRPTRMSGRADATLCGMNQRDLRAFAHRGLTARLAQLDEERARILVLLAACDDSVEPTVRRRMPKASPTHGRAPAATTLTEPADTASASAGQAFGTAPRETEIEAARVIPRRRRLLAPVVASAPALALPPMPRLVKARAS
jgi:hypothetical protein